MNRLGILILLFLVVVGGLWIYKIRHGSTLGNGSVTSKDGSAMVSEGSQGNGTTSNQPPAGERPASTQEASPQNSSEPVVIQSPTAAKAVQVPNADTVAPNPPNGLAFGGTGRYQWYRQGNLTWRVDTNSGEACVAFATMREWNNPIVYSHGCGNS